jgi:hypothetical protein
MVGDEHDLNCTFLAESIGKLGAVICGHPTYDTSMPWWGTDGPSGAVRRPVFVSPPKRPARALKGACMPS